MARRGDSVRDSAAEVLLGSVEDAGSRSLAACPGEEGEVGPGNPADPRDAADSPSGVEESLRWSGDTLAISSFRAGGADRTDRKLEEAAVRTIHSTFETLASTISSTVA
eukprot:658803-Prorocentrum_minimum.AAC.1